MLARLVFASDEYCPLVLLSVPFVVTRRTMVLSTVVETPVANERLVSEVVSVPVAETSIGELLVVTPE
jgi:hypothetical protein